jgi:hypothetical protein
MLPPHKDRDPNPEQQTPLRSNIALLSLTMTADAILRFLDFHDFVTAEALQMICGPKPGLQRLCLLELYTVATLT